MAWHLVLSRPLNVDQFRRHRNEGIGPRHALVELADQNAGVLHAPDPDRDPPNALDRAMSKLYSRPDCWSLARRLARELGPDDVVYCTGEDVGIPVVAKARARGKGPRIFVFNHNIDRPRGRLAARLFRLASRVDAVGACNDAQASFLRDRLAIPESRVHLLPEHVDNRFFSPGSASADKSRRLVVGVGLEKRDYRTLAQAAHDLDADVRISGFSQHAKLIAQSFPDPMPANMSRRFYSWPELQQLYRDADVVVAPLFPSRYAAGVTTLMEGLACHRPVVATRTEGLSSYLEPTDGLSIVEPFDAEGLRKAVVRLLEHPDEAQDQAESGYQIACKRYAFEPAVERMRAILKSL